MGAAFSAADVASLRGQAGYLIYLDNKDANQEPAYVPVREVRICRVVKRGSSYVISLSMGRYVRIEEPVRLNVSENGHRIFDASGRSHYIPKTWIHIEWKAKDGAAHFVR